MNKKNLALLAIGGAALGYELYALANKERGDTISEVVWDATVRRPLVPFAAGLLMGHFFWQRVPDEQEHR